ncbi:MerR family transcriptional regulator [Streptomyces sp. NPDC001985]|uniref:MerR family transcriptional regulator n=1 Tax=Streptomyces sp. NPDC001985 TaxID=3154406 RepID=UPI00332BC683
MYPFITPPRQVRIGAAAAFAGTTPRAVRHYHQIGLLPEPERGGDGRRRYGYDDMVRLLWIRRMAEVGISLDDMRTAFDDSGNIEETLGRLEESLAARESDIKRQRAAVERLRAVGSPLGLLSEPVTDRLGHLPRGALRAADMEALLITERIFGPLGSAIQAGLYIVLATHPGLRAEQDRLDEAEAALDDGVDPDDPRVEDLAVQQYTHHQALLRAITAAGLDAGDDELFETYEADPAEEERRMSAVEAVSTMPYDFSPARMRCMERVAQLIGQDDRADG